MQNSVKPMAELLIFKLRNFRDNVNDLRENYWLIFNSSLYIIEKVNSSALYRISTSFMYDHTSVWPLKTLHNY